MGANPHPSRVLVVDDQALVVEKLKIILSAHSDMAFATVANAANAVETAVAFRPTVILQDLVMPGIDGFELLSRYRETIELHSVPVVILSATDDPTTKERCFAEGANDYLVKLPDQIELLARIRYHSAAYHAREDRDQAFHLLKVSQQELAAANVLLQNLAALDGLTGIANRRRFDEVVAMEWGRASRSLKPLSLLMCDIDFFKAYNDKFGHVSGDFCIKRVAAVLTEELRRPADFVARYGGEEFAIILPDTDLRGALVVAEKCRSHVESLDIPQTGGEIGAVTISVGAFCLVPSATSSVEQLIDGADKALYAAKGKGRNRVDSDSVKS